MKDLLEIVYKIVGVVPKYRPKKKKKKGKKRGV